MSIIIYHNPRCSKSRETLALLKKKKITPQIIEYLTAPPSAQEIKEILHKLHLKAEHLVRKKESLYKEKFAYRAYSDKEWMEIL